MGLGSVCAKAHQIWDLLPVPSLALPLPSSCPINEAQEKVLVDWCQYNSDWAPLHRRTLHGRVPEMVGIYLGRNWVRRFIPGRHLDILVAKPRDLDPEGAQKQ